VRDESGDQFCDKNNPVEANHQNQSPGNFWNVTVIVIVMIVICGMLTLVEVMNEFFTMRRIDQPIVFFAVVVGVRAVTVTRHWATFCGGDKTIESSQIL
jgi:hypothetical protein